MAHHFRCCCCCSPFQIHFSNFPSEKKINFSFFIEQRAVSTGDCNETRILNERERNMTMQSRHLCVNVGTSKLNYNGCGIKKKINDQPDTVLRESNENK